VLEVLTGTGLAVAAGLNAYIPLLLLGLAARFLDWVSLPAGWSWLENPWVLGGIGALLVVELIADKIPVVDTINDWLQSIVRPAAGGIVFGSGSAAQTLAVTEPGEGGDQQWVPVVAGAVIALLVHLAKMAARPAANALTAGAAAPVLSTVEDLGAVLLTVLALVVPILVIVALIAAAVAGPILLARARRRRLSVDRV
jgi:hypothetical protein